MNETRRRETALGRLERKAHNEYPRYHMGLMGTGAVNCCPGPHLGVVKKEVPKGMLRVSYTDSFRWRYELNGCDVSRTAALEALGP